MSDAAFKARREAYEKALQTCNLTQRQILNVLGKHPNGLTRAEIARIGQIKLQTVCARVVELRSAGMVKELDERRVIDGSSASVLVSCEPPAKPPTLFDDQLGSESSYLGSGY